MTLHQHYFLADGGRSFGEDGEESWGEDGERVRERIRKELLRRDGAMGVESYEVERYGVERYRVENGATKKEQKKRASKIYLQSSLK